MKTPGKGETLLGLSLLLVLAGIALGIFMAQYRFNPAVFTAGPEGPSGSGPGQVSAVRSTKNLVPLPPGMVSMTPQESFGPHNLSEKIDGKAELYLSSGFQGLRCQRLARQGDPETWIEIFVFDMGGVMNAFSVFSSQRREDAEPADLTRFSYSAGNALFFVHGPHYVEIIASVADGPVVRIMEAVARDYVRARPLEGGGLGELAVFPGANLAEDSIVLLSSNAFGYDRLDRVFTATYRLDGTEVTAFLSRRKSPAEASKLVSAYHGFLLANGGRDLGPRARFPGGKMAEIMGTYELIFSRGAFLAGVREANTEAQADSLAVLLHDRLGEVAHGP